MAPKRQVSIRLGAQYKRQT